MNKRSHIHKKADSSASNPVRSQFQSRPNISQAKPQSEKPLTQRETENGEFQQQKFEATKLNLQAKNGTITPEGQEQLTVLQAKMSGLLYRRLEQASSKGSNFANIPISRPDAPSQLAVQTKLTIGKPGDKFEEAADEAAKDFVKQRYHARTPVSQQAEQNLQSEEKTVGEKEVQRKPMLQLRSAKEGMTAAPEVEAAIKQARGGGQSMPEKVRQPYEQHAGADYSRVKIHTDRRAQMINRSLGSVGCAVGMDVFLLPDKYKPGTEEGDEVLRHELEHTKQQNGSAVQRSQSNLNTPQISSVRSGDVSIQRLLGFEFETNLPASNLGRALDQGGKPHETAQETRLRKFLTGQAYADEEIHNFSGEGFSAVADHGPVSSAIEQARTRINFEMSRATLPDGTAKQYIGDQNAIDPRPGIVEYKTAAFDTSQPQGIEEFARTISRLATHMNNIYNQILSAGAANSPLSSTNWLVGVPLLADWNAFANRYNIPLNVMQEQRDNIMEKINQQIYPQITVGILPKNIPTLFKKTKEAGLTRGQDPNLSQLSEERSQLRVTHAEKVARKALQDLSNVTVTPDTEGYVTLIAQYVLGSLADAVDHFEITKNLPIFLSKAHLTGAQQTIANGNARPAGWSLEARERLTSKLWKYAAEYFNKTPHGMRVDRDTQGGFTKANALHILTNDQGDDPFIVATGTRTVGLDDHRDPQNNLRPNQEIPLEFRALENLVSPDQLNAWSNKIMFLITTQVNPL